MYDDSEGDGDDMDNDYDEQKNSHEIADFLRIPHRKFVRCQIWFTKFGNL